MRSHTTAAKSLESLDIRQLLDLRAWVRACEELAAAKPWETWGTHRHAALQHAHVYTRGDGHIHAGFEGQLGPAREVTERRAS